MTVRIRPRNILHLVAALAVLLCALGPAGRSVYAASSRFFPETGKTVTDPFLSYWTGHGGLSQQGYPITDAYNEKNAADGKVYLTQYFERARFEYHPENADPKFKVLLGLLGKEALAAKHGDTPPDSAVETVPGGGSKTFSETGKTVTGLFLSYWNTHGGLEQQGYPITNAYSEVNDADGQTYVTQYFERARFEYHPESADPKFKVLLGLVGREIYGLKQSAGGGGGTGDTGGGGTTIPGPTTATNTLSVPGWTQMVVTTNNIVFFYNAANGHGATARLNPDGSLTVLQKFPDAATGNTAFSTGVTTMAAGPNNLLLSYQRANGAASTCTMGDNGIIGQCKTFDFSPIWSNIAIDTVTGLSYYYSDSAGNQNIAKLNTDGSITTFKAETIPAKEPRQILPVGNGMWLIYVNNTKTGEVFSIKDNGDLSGIKGLPDLGTTWSIITSNRQTMVFYDRNNRTSLTASVALDGTIVKLKSYAAPGTVTHFAAAPGGPFLSYSSSNGLLTVTKVAQDGTATNLQQYQPGK